MASYKFFPDNTDTLRIHFIFQLDIMFELDEVLNKSHTIFDWLSMLHLHDLLVFHKIPQKVMYRVGQIASYLVLVSVCLGLPSPQENNGEALAKNDGITLELFDEQPAGHTIDGEPFYVEDGKFVLNDGKEVPADKMPFDFFDDDASSISPDQGGETPKNRGPPAGETEDGKPFWFEQDGKAVGADGKEIPFDKMPVDFDDASSVQSETPESRGNPAGETKNGDPFWFDEDGNPVHKDGQKVQFNEIADLVDDGVDDVARRVAGNDAQAGSVATAKPSPNAIKSFLAKNALLMAAGAGVAVEVAIAVPFVIMHFMDGEFLAGVGLLIGTAIGAIGGAALGAAAVQATAASVGLMVSGKLVTFAARFIIGAVPALGFAFLALMTLMEIFSGDFLDNKPAEEQIVDMMCFGHRGTTQPDPSVYNVTDMDQIKMTPAFVAEKFSGSDMLATQLLFIKFSGGELITRSQLIKAVRASWITCDGVGDFGCADYHVMKSEVGLVIHASPDRAPQTDDSDAEKLASYDQVKKAIEDKKLEVTTSMNCMDAEKVTSAQTEDEFKCITTFKVLNNQNLTDIFGENLDCSECEVLDCFKTILINRPEKRYCLDYCEPKEKTCANLKDQFDCGQCDTRDKCLDPNDVCWWMAISTDETKCQSQCQAMTEAPDCSKCTPDDFANDDAFCKDNCDDDREHLCSTFCATDGLENCGHKFCTDKCSSAYCEEEDTSILRR